MACTSHIFLVFSELLYVISPFNLGDKYDTAFIKSENYTSGHSSLTKVLGVYLMLLENLKVNFICYFIVLLLRLVKMGNIIEIFHLY